MKSVNIKLNLMTDGAKFVQIVGAYPYDMDLRSGRHVVDAKSILGIFSLDWSKPVTMEIYSDDCDDLLAEIKPFLASGVIQDNQLRKGLQWGKCRRRGLSADKRIPSASGGGGVFVNSQNKKRNVPQA